MIWFYDSNGKPLSVENCVSSIRVTIQQDQTLLKELKPEDPILKIYAKKTYVVIPIDEEFYEKYREYTEGEIVKYDVSMKGGTGDSVLLFAARKNRWVPYGVDAFNTDDLGFWVPVGLIGTNLTRSDGGVAFTAVPIGIAFGSKRILPRDQYIGVSGMASWSITKTKNDDSQEGKDSDFNASALGLGVLLDYSSWVYFGGIYNLDLTSAKNDPGFFFVVGAGPALLKVLSGGTDW